jgi:histidine ammonia-lyase
MTLIERAAQAVEQAIRDNMTEADWLGSINDQRVYDGVLRSEPIARAVLQAIEPAHFAEIIMREMRRADENALFCGIATDMLIDGNFDMEAVAQATVAALTE